MNRAGPSANRANRAQESQHGPRLPAGRPGRASDRKASIYHAADANCRQMELAAPRGAARSRRSSVATRRGGTTRQWRAPNRRPAPRLRARSFITTQCFHVRKKKKHSNFHFFKNVVPRKKVETQVSAITCVFVSRAPRRYATRASPGKQPRQQRAFWISKIKP